MGDKLASLGQARSKAVEQVAAIGCWRTGHLIELASSCCDRTRTEPWAVECPAIAGPQCGSDPVSAAHKDSQEQRYP